MGTPPGMKPTTKVAETTAPDGGTFRLLEHDGEYYLYLDERQVMSTKLTHSELMLADAGLAFRKKRKGPRVLIGGLGLGYSLRRCLEITGRNAVIEVAELLPEVVRWNRECLNGLNDSIMVDPRTKIIEGDVFDCIHMAAEKGPRYDSILLDVDDGPTSLIQPQNKQLYGRDGLTMIKQALTAGGRAAFWAATDEPQLLRHLKKAGFRAEEIPVAAHPRAKRPRHRIYVAERRD
jgi:spermidine synthase